MAGFKVPFGIIDHQLEKEKNNQFLGTDVNLLRHTTKWIQMRNI